MSLRSTPQRRRRGLAVGPGLVERRQQRELAALAADRAKRSFTVRWASSAAWLTSQLGSRRSGAGASSMSTTGRVTGCWSGQRHICWYTNVG